MKKIFATLLCPVLLAGCSFLDEENYTEFDSGTFFKDPKNVEYVVNGCYDQLQQVAPALHVHTEIPTDYVCVSPNKQNASETLWHNGVFSYNDSYPTNTWERLYSLIYNCNYLIDNIGQATLDEQLRNRYVAEARFLRGWAYLMLTNLFRDVPLRTTSAYKNAMYDEPLTSQEKIYDFLIEDLEYAEAHLYEFSFGRSFPEGTGIYDDGERMRASVDAVIGMQALAYLYRAGNDSSSPWWEKARDKAAQLIERCGGAGAALSSGWLADSYYGLFHGTTRYGQENLFAVYYSNSAKGEGSNIANNWAIYTRYSKAVNAGFRRFTNQWYQKHFAGHYDKRNAEGLMHEIQNNAGAKFIFPDLTNFTIDVGVAPGEGYTNPIGSNPTAKAYGPWLSKYNDENAPSSGCCETGLVLLRYADVLLIFAEAENELSPASAAAYEALNAVRARAGVGDAPAGMDQAAFRTFVLEEREREFFGESKRLFDLNRREMYGTKIRESATATEYANVNRERNYEVKWFDIPKVEVDANRVL